MKFRNKKRLRIIKNFSIGWALAFIFLSIVRGVGTTEKGNIDFEFWTSILFSVIMGSIFGVISGFAQILTEERAYQRISFQKLLAIRLVYSVLFLMTLILAGYVLSKLYLGISIGLIEFAFDDGSFAIYFYVITVDLFMVILRQVNLMLGEGNLSKHLHGKFYTPREEERIFMFLDLQSSTQLAEKLGHIKYSMLIQDCFNDLGVVVENEAEIYQYVGDEVILTWKQKDGLRNQNCLNAYFNFKKELTRKQDHYLEKYDCKPFFKAGLNTGIVTVTEVGKYKKEIAYHGDTINTAARIQDKCNELNRELLISENLKIELSQGGFQFEKIGSVSLKGKGEEALIYGVFEGNPG